MAHFAQAQHAPLWAAPRIRRFASIAAIAACLVAVSVEAGEAARKVYTAPQPTYVINGMPASPSQSAAMAAAGLEPGAYVVDRIAGPHPRLRLVWQAHPERT